MEMIARIAEALQTVLGPVAQEAGRQSGLIQRARKLDGASFVRLLVFGYQGQPEATLEDLVKVGASMGVPSSPQGLAQRFTAEAARGVQQVLAAAVGQVVAATPAVDSLLGRFSGLYLQDATTFALPDELAALGVGAGGSGPQAALKVQVQWEYRTGQVTHLQLQNATCHDTQAACQRAPLPAGALRLADLGYFKLAQMAHDLAQGVYWLTRLHTQCRLRLAGVAEPLELLAFLRQQGTAQGDVLVEAGLGERLPCRLLAVQVPQEVADQRRAHLRARAAWLGRTLSAARLALAEWNLFLTTVPRELLSLREALVVARVRWQMELLFKLWKQHARLGVARSQNPWRVLWELLAKWLGVLLQHWLLLLAVWPDPARSLFKAFRALRPYAALLAVALTASGSALSELALTAIQSALLVGSRISKRRQVPATFQLLCDPALLSLS